MRSLTIDGHRFLWRREHVHIDVDSHTACAERLVVYLDGFKRSALRIEFHENEDWRVGYSDAGVVICSGTREVYNLNRPAVVKSLVAYALLHGLLTRTSTRSYEISDGLTLFQAASVPAETAS